MGKVIELPYGVCLDIAYRGTHFHGWQHQEGLRTVQGVIEEAIDKMGLKHSRLRGASRTDAGVHAYAQKAAFGCEQDLPMRAWTQGFNTLLPEDVVVTEARPCHRRYNPRFHTAHKRYRYLFRCAELRDPFWAERVWYIGPKLARRDVVERVAKARDFLDIDAMHCAAEVFIGTHDFQAFRALSDERETTERTMFAAEVIESWEGHEDLVAFEVVGDAFMKNMVRIMAGTLLEVGRGRMNPEQVCELLEPGATRPQAGETAPPQGLTLVEIKLERFDEPE